MPACVVQLSSGLRGFDTDTPVPTETARQLRSQGFRFVLRYVPRLVARSTDVTSVEVSRLLAAGLAFIPVQHVESPGWAPSEAKGRSYGRNAAQYILALGVPLGCWAVLDLEGVDPRVSHDSTIAYCNSWHAEVAGAGYKPALYVGWHCGLTAAELYSRLRFRAYWAAYNLDRDQYPAKRGIQMQQLTGGTVAGIELDPDIVHPDAFGDLPLACASTAWLL